LLPWLNVPWQVRVCVDRIYELGIENESDRERETTRIDSSLVGLGAQASGIFRVPGSTGVINTLFDKLEHGIDSEIVRSFVLFFHSNMLLFLCFPVRLVPSLILSGIT
jgi:hypothetical protein